MQNDGAVLPILDLNGFKISNPTIFSRMSDEEITKFFEGLGYSPRFIENDDIHDYALITSWLLRFWIKLLKDIQAIKGCA